MMSIAAVDRNDGLLRVGFLGFLFEPETFRDIVGSRWNRKGSG